MPPYNPDKPYCSVPGGPTKGFQGHWNYACWIHDNCYGSCIDRRSCDDCFLRMMRHECRDKYRMFDPRHATCLGRAWTWYKGIRTHWGASHYRPHCGKRRRTAIVRKECPDVKLATR